MDTTTQILGYAGTIGINTIDYQNSRAQGYNQQKHYLSNNKIQHSGTNKLKNYKNTQEWLKNIQKIWKSKQLLKLKDEMKGQSKNIRDIDLSLVDKITTNKS